MEIKSLGTALAAWGGEAKRITLTNEEAGALARRQELRVRVTTTAGINFCSEPVLVGKDGFMMIPPEAADELLTAIPESQQPPSQNLHVSKEIADVIHKFEAPENEQ